MVIGLLHQWLWSSNLGGRDQIRLPAVMAACFLPANDPTIPKYFPLDPAQLANYFQHLFWQWWTPSLQVEVGNKDHPKIRLCDIASSCPGRSAYQSFLNPKSLLPLGRTWTVWSRGVLRVSVSKNAVDGVESWAGEFVGFGTPP